MRSSFRLLPAILVVLVMLVGDTLDSFGLSSAADERGMRVSGRMLAPFYGAGGAPARESISVMLISDASLDAYNTGPPPPYQMQADLIFRLAPAKPAAIFFDFIYTHPRERDGDIAYLGQAIDFAAQLGVPVFTGPRADRPEFAPWKAAGQVDLGWEAQRETDYPFAGGTGRPTAAAALYRAICQERPDLACAAELLDEASGARAPAMSVQWGEGVSPGLEAYWNPDEVARCPKGASDVLGRTLAAMGREAARGALAGTQREPVGCFFHLTAPAHVLLGAQPEAFDDFAAGRVVLVGSAYTGSTDIVDAPGFGRIPGVMQHAMALDNLLTYHGAYRRWPAALFWELDLDDLLEGVLCVLLLLAGATTLDLFVRRADAIDNLVGEAGELPKPVRPEVWRANVVAPAAGLFGFAGLVLLAPIAYAGVATYALYWPPANVLGVAGTVVGVGLILARREQIGRLIQPQILKPVGLGAMIYILCLIVVISALIMNASAQSPVILLVALLAGTAVSVSLASLTVALLRPRGAAGDEG